MQFFRIYKYNIFFVNHPNTAYKSNDWTRMTVICGRGSRSNLTGWQSLSHR